MEEIQDPTTVWPATPTPWAGRSGYEATTASLKFFYSEDPVQCGLPAHYDHSWPQFASWDAMGYTMHSTPATCTPRDGNSEHSGTDELESLDGPDGVVVGDEQAHMSYRPDTTAEVVVVGADMPSKGSALHAGGLCRPCAWFWKPQGCNSGKNCSYCHLCPEGELKERKKMKVAAMRKGAPAPSEASDEGSNILWRISG
mmetsp:Transcript_17791/g.41455  ORF Transcript_17791/g.41455 Transcript_17791/m.41455 type:complete len:199 (+) Transcript_17791:83-679(+)|eukprot:CAMPEP_0178411724 /NCGR_PEP_ID=MMETSP0689_2-20121128/21641_1 /TAXON_ID=160604 /ORGANISM="Amphidinium massartii, Strain CS-259" /LENGTH=198 /DNA_ID=CAMNT_0020032937 /DNA_START=82 /DNA_END=678 /DNA_ORIENTATION=+